MIAWLGWQYKPVTAEVIGFKIQIQIYSVPLLDEESERGRAKITHQFLISVFWRVNLISNRQTWCHGFLTGPWERVYLIIN